MAARLKMMLTFKQSEKWIYDEIMKHSGKGNYVKDILAQHMQQPQQFNSQPSTPNRKVTIDDLL